MNQTTIFIFATIYPKKDSFNKTKEILKSIIENTRKEKGCLEFTLHKDIKNNRIYLYEEWKNESCIDKHFTYEYTINAAKKIENHLEKQTEVIKMEKIK